MKRILFCNIPMRAGLEKTVYTSGDRSLPVLDVPTFYPVSSFLGRTLEAEDEIRAVLLVKDDARGHCFRNAELCREELTSICAGRGAAVTFETLATDFSESRSTHNSLLMQIVEQLEERAHILADITYGPKDLPIVLFSALNFAERFYDCEIDNLIYGRAIFENGAPASTQLCDMIPLYSLNSLTNAVKCRSAQEAKQMLKLLLSM